MSLPRDGRALVTGATGFIGGHLAEALLHQGAAVRVLARDPRRWGGSGAEVVRGDIAQPDSLREAVRDVDVVYHVAGVTKALDDAEYERVNHGGTLNVLEACREVNGGLRRFVLVSSQAAAGPAVEGRPVREDDPPRPVSAYGLSKHHAERTAAAYGDLFPVAIVRPPVVYGPRDRDTLLVFRVASRGLIPRLARIRALSIVHVADLVRGILLAGTHPAAVNRTYFMANAEPATLSDLTRPVADECGARPIEIPLPVPPLYLAATLAEFASRLTGRRSPLTRNKVREATERLWVCDSSRAARELGWHAEVPLERGLRETACWYGERGWL